MLTALVIFAVTVAVGIFILYPLLSSQSAASAPEGATDELMLERDQLFQDIRELEFDYRMGKLADADYTELLDQLKSQAAAVIEEIEGTGGAGSAPAKPRSAAHVASDADIEARIAAARKAIGANKGEMVACPECGKPNPVDARFCNSCGAAMTEQTKEDR